MQDNIFRVHWANEWETPRPAVERFFQTRYPNIELRFAVTPGRYNEAVWEEIKAHDVPDVIYVHESRFRSFAKAGVLLPLDDFLTRQPLPGDLALYPLARLRDGMTYRGKIYALPAGFAVVLLCYNKIMFQRAGVTLPSATWTWDDPRRAAAALTRADTQQWGWVGWNPAWFPSWGALLKSFGARHFNDAQDTCIISEVAGVQALDIMRSFWCGPARSSPLPADKRRLESGGGLFEAGLAAMDVTLSQNVSRALSKIAGAFEMGLELFPAGPKGQFMRAGGTNYGIPVGARHPDIAWELLHYLTTDEEAGRLQAQYGTGHPLIRRDYMLAYNAPQGYLADEWKRVMTASFDSYGVAIEYGPMVEYERICTTPMEKMAAGETSAWQTADAIASVANTFLEERRHD